MAKNKSSRQKASGNHKGTPASFVRVCLLFLGLVLACQLILLFLPVNPVPFEILTAKITAALLNISGLHVVQDGVFLRLPKAYWEVSLECTAIFALIVYGSFVLAYSASFRAKAYGLALGLPFLVMVNILRLFVLAWVSELAPEFSDSLHDYGWQVVLLLAVALMWMVWIETVVASEKKADISH